MKKYSYGWITICVLFMLSCKKDNTSPKSLASFAVINVINNGAPVKADFTGKDNVFATTQVETGYNTFKRFAVSAGATVPVKIVSSINIDEVIFNQSFIFQPGDVYSLFLAGEQGVVDTMLVKDQIPARLDGVMGVRIINCSPSGPIKIVTLQEDYLGVRIPQADIPLLGYMEKTGFITYPAPPSVSFYRIELRDPVTDDLLLTTSVLPANHFTTVIIRGYIGGSPSIGVTRMVHGR